MHKRISVYAIALSVALLSACGNKEEPAKPPAPAVAASAPVLASAPEEPKRSAPDFGGTTKVSREVEAVGSTLELAVVSALQLAVSQVNGVKVASQLQSLRTGIDVSVDGQNAGSIRAEAFAQKMIAKSQGMVLGYEILKQEEIDKIDEETIAKVRAMDGGFSYSASASSQGAMSVKANADHNANAGDMNARSSGSFSGSSEYNEKATVDAKKGASSYSSDVTNRKMRSYWKVRVRAEIAQYRAPEEAGRPKIVVALAKTLAHNYPVGDNNVSANEIAQSVRGRLSDILTQTKRFIVLDREFGADMQAEIDRINSGNVRAQDAARIGQQMATDLILIPTIERFQYSKEVRKLRMADRELISYSGGGRITLRLLNATTGEIVMSDSFEHKLAAADPSTMPRVIDGKSMAAEMMSKLSSQIGSAIVSEIFPVSVVALNGDQVVLSQGGESLQVGQHWQAVYLGEALKDPQTGRSLGRSELPVGTIRIDRVSSQTSYGTLENGTTDLGSKPFTPGAIELRKQLTKAAQTKDQGDSEKQVTAAKPPTATESARRVVKPVENTGTTPATAPPNSSSNDNKW